MGCRLGRGSAPLRALRQRDLARGSAPVASTPLHRGVYAVGHANVTLEGRFLAAVKACGAGHGPQPLSAAALYGIVEWDDRFPEVTAERRRATPPRHPRPPPRASATRPRRPQGIPVTTPARTLVDLASVLPYKPLRRAVREAHGAEARRRPRSSSAAMQPNRRGTANLDAILATGPAPTRSELEDVVLDLILRGGLVAPDVNVPLPIDGRRVDPRLPLARAAARRSRPTAPQWHDNRVAREDDAERQALLEAHGERVVRVTWEQAVAPPKRRPSPASSAAGAA